MFDKNENTSVIKIITKYPAFIILTFFIAFSLASLSGCAQNNLIRRSASAPLGEVISPVKDSQQIIAKKIPLTFPSAVAIIFVPGNGSQSIPDTTLHIAAAKLKEQLLGNSKFIKSVTVVSGDDLKAKISFERIQALYTADIIVLMSYQQDQRTQQVGAAGLADLTVIGAFLIPGVETKTSTIIDGKVIHIANNAMIFKANGSDERSVHSSSYGRGSTATEESIQGLLAATTDLGKSLSQTLEKFDAYDASQAVSMSSVIGDNTSAADRTVMANDYWNKVDKFKSTGSGAFGWVAVFLAVALCWATRRLN